MILLPNPRPGQIVLVERDDHGGNRIPEACRCYIGEGTYLYRARIVSINPQKRYNKVAVLSWNPREELEKTYIRKAYKSKIYGM